MTDKPSVIFIMGATATGKTALAARLYETLNCEIISVDSALVYRGMDIGTAKPSKALLADVPHHLIDICDPSESYSAARFQQDASTAIEMILAKHKVPVLVGGTGLYYRALEQGLSKLPKADHRIRAELEDEADKQGWQSLHQRLQKIDPKAAARIHEHDRQRIQRALEVYLITGQSLSTHWSIAQKQVLPYSIKKIILVPEDRTLLRERIKQRFVEMLNVGLVEEVQSLYARGDLSLALPAMRLVGYRHVWLYLTGKINYQEMQEQAIIATGQLAKRQITWCRGEANGEWYDPYKIGIASQIIEKLTESSTII